MLPLLRTLFSFSHVHIFTSFTICNKIFPARKILLYPPPTPLTLCAVCASCSAILRKIMLAWSPSSFKICSKRWKPVLQLVSQHVTLFPLSVLLSYGISMVQTSPSQGWLNPFLFYSPPATQSLPCLDFPSPFIWGVFHFILLSVCVITLCVCYFI